MSERWQMQDEEVDVDGDAAVDVLQRRLRAGERETWFESETGRLLAFVTNGVRSMVMLLDGVEDAGQHAIDESAGAGTSGGFVLSNGQLDSYVDRDTVPIATGLQIVREVVDGIETRTARWHDDR